MAYPLAAAELRQTRSRARPGAGLLSALIRFEVWLDTRRSRRALDRMDERALKDLGLTPADLDRPDPASSWQALVQPPRRG